MNNLSFARHTEFIHVADNRPQRKTNDKGWTKAWESGCGMVFCPAKATVLQRRAFPPFPLLCRTGESLYDRLSKSLKHEAVAEKSPRNTIERRSGSAQDR